jgi:hypothetical protein
MRTPVKSATQEGPRELSFRDGTVMITTARVLVVWVGYNSGPWAVRSLRDAGYDVLASHPEEARGGRSTAALDPRRYPSPSASPDAFVRWLEETCRDERISAVLALDPDATRLIAQRGPNLSGAVFAGPSAQQYGALCDPAGFARTALAAGVDAAVQVTGQPWELHCVRGDGGFAMVAGRVASTYPRAGGPGSVVQIVDAPTELGRAAARLLDQVDYRGSCAMSVTERDGRFWFHDVRPGLSPSVGAAAAAGFDQPTWGVEAALGHFRPPSGTARSMTYLPLQTELAALRDALAGRSHESPTAIARSIARAVVARDQQLDPPLSDPAWIASTARHGLRRITRGGDAAA